MLQLIFSLSLSWSILQHVAKQTHQEVYRAVFPNLKLGPARPYVSAALFLTHKHTHSRNVLLVTVLSREPDSFSQSSSRGKSVLAVMLQYYTL